MRYDFDHPKLDSFSGRISWNPARNLALQISHGYLHSPEELEPDEVPTDEQLDIEGPNESTAPSDSPLGDDEGSEGEDDPDPAAA